jgi:hypothetical protein
MSLRRRKIGSESTHFHFAQAKRLDLHGPVEKRPENPFAIKRRKVRGTPGCSELWHIAHRSL